MNGELFERLDLDNYRITNHHLLRPSSSLVLYEDNESSTIRRVNFTALDVEELGSVYESLLDYQPCISTSGSLPTFELNPGSERKTTGSYYTPADLVAELIRTALEPVVRERLERADTAEAKEQALLSIRVIDPACGSGHFLLAAARRLGKELARIRTNEDEPAPERVREAIRDVVTHCIYGVDKNPSPSSSVASPSGSNPTPKASPLLPRSPHPMRRFPRRRLRSRRRQARYPRRGLHARLARRQRHSPPPSRNATARPAAGQMTFFTVSHANPLAELSTQAQAIERIPDASPTDIREKKKRFDSLQSQAEPHRRACNLWTAAFFQPKTQATPSEAFITTEELRAYAEDCDLHPRVAGQADALAHQYRFFHWPVEFPDVFANEGFDVVLSNPPWERIKLEEQEFFGKPRR